MLLDARERGDRNRDERERGARAGDAAPAALTGGFQQALWVLGGIGLLAVPAIFALVRHEAGPLAVAKTSVGDQEPALAATS